jgi:shikimate kinase
MVITLIGSRGSGKSSVAAPLADALGWEWIDADDEIERRAGCSIREIFENDGEPKFRELEEETLDALLSREQLVIAAGGGAILSEKTREKMKSSGPVVWLKASVEVLASRIEADVTTTERRPNLTSQGGRQEIETVLAIREPLYRDCATVTVETDDRNISEIVTSILSSIQKNNEGRKRSS